MIQTILWYYLYLYINITQNMKKITVTEETLRNIVGNIVHEVLCEAKSIKSDKLQDIIKQHGGLGSYHGPNGRNYVNTDLHNMDDSQVVGVVSYDKLNKIQGLSSNSYAALRDYAIKNGFQVEKEDIVDYERLRDGMYLIYIERNANFEYSKKEGGFKDLYDKRENRRKQWWNDGKNTYKPMTPKAEAARELRTRIPYKKKKKRGELKDPQSGWTNPERRKLAMDYIRQGKDAWGYEPKL